jgi:hypothetical protein
MGVICSINYKNDPLRQADRASINCKGGSGVALLLVTKTLAYALILLPHSEGLCNAILQFRNSKPTLSFRDFA